MVSKLRLLLAGMVVLGLLMGMASPAFASQVVGTPQLGASVVGSNEFTAGQSAALQVTVLNTGTFTGQIIGLDDQVMVKGYANAIGATVVAPCTTAQGITATLKSSNDAIQVVSGPATIASLATGAATPQPIPFQLRIAQNAQPGDYQLELDFAYQYLNGVSWLNPPQLSNPYYTPNFQFSWGQKLDTQTIAVQIIGTYFTVTSVTTDSIRAGATGTITATLTNSGSGQVTNITAAVTSTGDFTPVDSGTFFSALNGGQAKTVSFKVSVSPQVTATTSPLNILIKYKDANNVDNQTTVTVGVPIGVAQNAFSVTRVATQEVRPGATGIISLTLSNGGTGNIHEVNAGVVPGQYFVPVDTGSYIGNMVSGSSVNTQFKVAVSKDAIAKMSPLDVLVKYKDDSNIQQQSVVTIGVQVGAAPQFDIPNPIPVIDGKLTPGATTIINIPVKNTGDFTLTNAIARINVVDPFATAPFSTTDESAYLGTLTPGATGIGQFKLSVDSDAVPKTYTLDVQIKYWDSLNNSYTSDPVNAVVTVQAASGLSVYSIVLIAAGVLVVILILVNISRRSKKKKA